MSNEQDGQTENSHLSLLIERLGGSPRIGPIGLSSEVALLTEHLPNGDYEVIERRDTNTGELLRISDGEGSYALKTNLWRDHSYLDFRQPWKRVWSMANEFAKVSLSQMDWLPSERTHLGVVGVGEVDGRTVQLTDISRIDGDSIEPGLLMRWLPAETNLLSLLEHDSDTFERLVPTAIRSIRDSQSSLCHSDAFRYGSADAVLGWIDGGNLNNLRRSTDSNLRYFASQFWSGFSSFIDRNRFFLDQRCGEHGVCVWSNGDTKLLNGYAVGDRVAFIDPIALLIQTGSGEKDFELAPWPLHDRIADLSYFTVYLRAYEWLATAKDSRWDWAHLRFLRRSAIDRYGALFREDVSGGQLAALHHLYEAGYASVEYEVNLRLAQGTGSTVEQERSAALALAMEAVALEALEDAHQDIRNTRFESGLSNLK